MFVCLYAKTGSGGFEGQIGRLWWNVGKRRGYINWTKKNEEHQHLFSWRFL